MKTITIDTIKAMSVSTFSVQDDSPRGIKTVTAEEIKPGDRVVIDDHFCEVVEAPEQEQTPEQEQAEPREQESRRVIVKDTTDEYIAVYFAGGAAYAMNVTGTGANVGDVWDETGAGWAEITTTEAEAIINSGEIIADSEQKQQDTTPIDGEDFPARDTLGEVREYLYTLSDGEKVDIWNEYTDATNNPDDRIYSMDEFDEIFSDVKPWEIARACFYSRRFNPSDDWFWFNGYGNVESADYISEHDDRCPIDLDAVAEYVNYDNGDNILDDIRAILDGEEVRI